MSSETHTSVAPSPGDADSKSRRAPEGSELRPRTFPVAAWIVFCAFCNIAGWLLSAAHQLNKTGYAIAFALGFAGLVVWAKRTQTPLCLSPNFPKLRRRFRRPFPRAFLLLAGLGIVGGLLHAPSNYDALTYRIPRVLHWLAADGWHWIPTNFNRLNTRGCGVEWVSAPIIAFTGTDRFLFLINVVCIFLLPGLLFGVFTRLGVPRRAAWAWMWLAATGYNFLLQVGSIANDMYGALFALAAVDFALRARETRRVGYFWLSLLSAGLMTAAKSSNLTLLLPVAIALLPSVKLALRRPLATAAVCVCGAIASLLPTMVLNWRNCGDWTGLKAEPGMIGQGPAWLYVSVNSVDLTLQNLEPPVFPLADRWNALMRRVVPAGLNQRLENMFEPAAGHFALGEMEMEEGAGLGFGVTLLLLLSVAAAIAWHVKARPPPRADAGERRFQLLVILGACIGLLVFLSKSGMSCQARLITPSYCLVLPLFLRGRGQAWVVRRSWWRRAAYVSFALAGLLLVVIPARPLWPVNAVLDRLDKNHASHLLTRARTVYSVYGQRSDGFAPARKLLPPDVAVVGFVSADDPETSLWRPFGSRRVEHIRSQDNGDTLRQRGIHYAWVKPGDLQMMFNRSCEDWIAANHAEIAATLPLTLRAGKGPVDWYLIRLP